MISLTSINTVCSSSKWLQKQGAACPPPPPLNPSLDLSFPRDEKTEQNKKLKIMLKWEKLFFDVILDDDSFTDLKNKRQLI